MPRTLLACLICLVSAVACAQDAPGEPAAGANTADDLDQVLSSWERTQRDIKSLAVEFTFTIQDKVFGTKEKADGNFRLVRTPDGNIRASCEWTPENRNGPRLKAGLLDSRTVYYFDDTLKTEFHWKLGDKDPIEFLADCFNPLTVLLDRKRAEQVSGMEVTRDEAYTYLLIKPKHPKDRKAGWLTLPGFALGRVTLMNADSASVPKGMPKQLWHCVSNGNETFVDIKSWRMNAADGPTVADLDKSVNLPGWTVHEWDWPASWRDWFRTNTGRAP